MKLGTRGSPLALTQARLVAGLLAHATGKDMSEFPLESFVTSGDKLKDQKLQDAGGKVSSPRSWTRRCWMAASTGPCIR